MTGRTHDLAAFTTLTLSIAYTDIPQMTLATGIVAFSANMLGGLAPDIDQPTAKFWNRLPAGSVLARAITPILGGHRLISHSFVGILIFGVLLDVLLTAASSVLLVDMKIVWFAFMLGFVSHLLIDMLTKEGVPWLFPIPIRFGIPPIKALRITTGELFEKSVLFPALLLINGYIIYRNYHEFIDFMKTATSL